jgi:2-methylcitrate dehydratase
MPCQIRVHLTGGEVIETECLHPPGHSFPDRGLSRAPVEEKFKEVTADLLPRERQARIVEELLDLRNRKTVAPTMSLLSA